MYLEKPIRFSKNFLKFLLCIILIGACTKGTFHSIKPIPFIHYTIPSKLQNNSEAVQFIQQTSEALNVWAELFDKLRTEQQTLMKSDSDRTIYQHVRLVSLSESYVNQRQKFLIEHEQIHEKAKVLSMHMSKIEGDAFNSFIAEMVRFKENVLNETNASIAYTKLRF
jgi:hypothetical protein